MKGISLSKAELTANGLLYDRHWMVVGSNGRFVTQREIPHMTMIHTSLDTDGLVMSMQGHESIQVPYDIFDGGRIETKVWGDTCETVDQGENISDWLTKALKSKNPLRLVTMIPEFTRPQSKAEILGTETSTQFADAAPFLVANEASLERLNTELERKSLHKVPMNRFRPNIVVEGLEAFTEHHIATLSAENYRFKLRGPCQRCIITTIDQDTAQKDHNWQPFNTLKSINPMPGKKAPAFAQYATLSHGDGHNISVGDHLAAEKS